MQVELSFERIISRDDLFVTLSFAIAANLILVLAAGWAFYWFQRNYFDRNFSFDGIDNN